MPFVLGNGIEPNGFAGELFGFQQSSDGSILVNGFGVGKDQQGGVGG